FGKTVAHAVTGSASDGSGLAAFTPVERNAVKVVLNLHLSGIVGKRRHLAAGRIWILGRGAREDQILSVGTPDRAGLHITRIVGAGQRMNLAGVAVIPGQNSARGIENLQKAIVLEVGHVEKLAHAATWRLDGGDHVPAVG